MAIVASVIAIADLRHRRRELRLELARVRWWRKLVTARHDLTVGQLSQATSANPDLDTAWEALAAGAPTPGELAEVIWPEPKQSEPSAIERLDSLDGRLGVYESRLSDNLESVTTQMVDAMGAAKQTETDNAT